MKVLLHARGSKENKNGIIISFLGEPYGILIDKAPNLFLTYFMLFEFNIRAISVSESVILRLSLLASIEDAYPPIV